MRILVVDDEQDICEILQFNLETEGYEVTTANSAEEALKLSLKQFDLFLLDVMMQNISGFELAQRIKTSPETKEIPIIFITALDDEENTVHGLDLGADDYIGKPLSMKEVKARINAVLRRSTNKKKEPKEETNADKIVYEDLTLDLSTKTASLKGSSIQLTKLEFELLGLFLKNKNKVFGRNDLLERCWPQNVMVSDRTVDVNITRLRKKIGPYGQLIKTRVGYGYYFEN